MTALNPDRAARAIGGLLCAAAVLKAVDAFNSHIPGLESTAAMIGSCVEFGIGVALAFRIFPGVSNPAAGVLFVLLAGVSLMGTLRGAANCHCLGAIESPPWALLIFDVAAAAILLWRPLSAGSFRKKQAVLFGAACVGTVAVGLVIGSIFYPPSEPSTTATSAQAIAAAKVVTIDPALIRTSPSLLLKYIDIDADLSRGEWKIIMARSGCQRCEQFMRSGQCKPAGRERVAVVLVDEDKGWKPPAECKAIIGHLSGDKTWQVQVPFMFRLIDGRVATQ